MGKQYNKGEKARRRQRYVKRKKTAAKVKKTGKTAAPAA
jgi:hypothetical protein